jgi:ribonuclease HI
MLLTHQNLDQDFIQAFADDLAVLIQGFDLNETMRSIAIRYLKTIDNWCTANGLKLSTLKTKIIIFSTLNKKYTIDPITLNNQTLDFSTEIKYLGVTFDKHLRWTPHIKNKCKAATKLLHMCRNYVAKKCGLSPARSRWIYKQVILPTLSYACFAWIHKVDKINYIKHMLNKVQKLATLQITGGFKNSPNITLDVVAGLLPITTFLEFRATLTTLRLKIEKNWHGNYSLSSKIISHAYHLDKQIDKHKLTNLIPLLDTVAITNIDKNYSVTLDLPQELPVSARYDVFTDGSLIKRDRNQLTGAGFTISRDGNTVAEVEISLGQLATINQCEMLAILRAAELIDGLDPQNEVIIFYSDSLSTLLQLDRDTTKSKLTLDTNKMLNKLGLCNQVHLYKVKAHTGISGNERADILAKSAASIRPIGPEPFLYISWSNIVSQIFNDSKAKIIKTIQDHNMKDSGKTLLCNYISKNGIQPCSRNKKFMRELTHMLSGQNWLGNNHNKRNPNISPFCEHCTNTKETAEHFIGECPA